MITPQTHHAALSSQEASKEIQELSGKSYDPKVVEAFMNAWDTGEIQAIIEKY
jgi:response regulator RpfG family c-di-GMP phosphodiesterase